MSLQRIWMKYSWLMIINEIIELIIAWLKTFGIILRNAKGNRGVMWRGCLLSNEPIELISIDRKKIFLLVLQLKEVTYSLVLSSYVIEVRYSNTNISFIQFFEIFFSCIDKSTFTILLSNIVHQFIFIFLNDLDETFSSPLNQRIFSRIFFDVFTVSFQCFNDKVVSI